MHIAAKNNVSIRMVTAEEGGQRLDNYLLRVLKGVPKSHIYRIIRGGEVRVNSKRAKPDWRLASGDKIRIPPLRTTLPQSVLPSQSLRDCLLAAIIHEDDNLLILAKPAGIAVHGGSGLSLGVIEALRAIRGDLAYLELVHRLDKETSGCLMLAKKRKILRELQDLLANRRIQKNYWALLLHPWQGQSTVVVDMPLHKFILQSGERMVIASDAGKPSRTQFKLLANYPAACWVEVRPTTGRTHQIRVHATHLGHPVVGDLKYGQAPNIPALVVCKPRMYLHAHSLQFTLNGQDYYVKAPLDDTFNQALTLLGELHG